MKLKREAIWLTNNMMSASYVYYSSALVWMFPPGRVVSSIEKFMKAFDNSVWLLFVLVLVTASCFVAFLKFYCPTHIQDFVVGTNIQSPGLNIINVTLEGSLTRLPARNFARTILAIFMMYCFILENSYKGQLFKFSQKKLRESDIKSTDELISKNFTFYMYSTGAAYFTNMPLVMERAQVVNQTKFSQ